MRSRLVWTALLVFVTVLPVAAVAASSSKTLYLSGISTPVASLSLDGNRPGGALPDFDDSGEDGRRLNRSDKGVNETNEDEYQTFRANVGGLEISGAPSLKLWVRMKNEDDEDTGAITAFLLDCFGSSCDLLGTATKTLVPGGPWVQTTLNFPSMSHTFASGHEISLMVIVPKHLSDDHMDIAYHTSSYPSSLSLPQPVTTTTTTITTTTTTVASTTTTTVAATTTTAPPSTTSSGPVSSPTTTTYPASTSTTDGVVDDSNTSTSTTSTTTPTTTETTVDDSPEAGAVVSTTTTTLVRTYANLSTEKSNLVVKTTPAQRGATIGSGSADLSPVEGLMVSFLTAVESIQNKFATSASLGVLMSVLLLVGLTRRERPN